MLMNMIYSCSVKTHFFIINDPTMTRAPPVAHDGKEANIGAKKTETRNMRPVTMAVMPVFPPSRMSVSALTQGKDRLNNMHPIYRWPTR